MQGIYFIYEQDQIVYIGKSTNVKNRLNGHSSAQSGRYYKFLPVENLSDMAILELAFIDKYKPIENKQDNFSSTSTIPIALFDITQLDKIPLKTLVIEDLETKYMARIPQAEITEAMQELSSSAFKLLMYYYSRRDGWRFVDKHIADAIDSTERMVKKYRKELVEKGYLLIQRGEVDVYFLGKGAVTQFYKEIAMEDTIDEEPTEPVYSPQ